MLKHDPIAESLRRTPVQDVTLGGSVNRGSPGRGQVDARMPVGIAVALRESEGAEPQRKGPAAAEDRYATWYDRPSRGASDGAGGVTQGLDLGIRKRLQSRAQADQRVSAWWQDD